MIVMQEFGRSLVVEPYFETVVLAGGLIEDAVSPERRDALLPKIMDGSAVLDAGPGRKGDHATILTTSRRQRDTRGRTTTRGSHR